MIDPIRFVRWFPELEHFASRDDRIRAWAQAKSAPPPSAIKQLLGLQYLNVAIPLFLGCGLGILLMALADICLREWAIAYRPPEILFPIVGIAVVLTIVVLRKTTRIRRSLRIQLNESGFRICTECGYDLRGTDGSVCSECGSEYVSFLAMIRASQGKSKPTRNMRPQPPMPEFSECPRFEVPDVLVKDENPVPRVDRALT